MEKAGKISALQMQTNFRLDLNGVHLTVYRCDFDYIDQSGKRRIEDVKGMRKSAAYELYRLKARLMLAIHNILVEEV